MSNSVECLGIGGGGCSRHYNDSRYSTWTPGVNVPLRLLLCFALLGPFVVADADLDIVRLGVWISMPRDIG